MPKHLCAAPAAWFDLKQQLELTMQVLHARAAVLEIYCYGPAAGGPARTAAAVPTLLHCLHSRQLPQVQPSAGLLNAFPT